MLAKTLLELGLTIDQNKLIAYFASLAAELSPEPGVANCPPSPLPKIPVRTTVLLRPNVDHSAQYGEGMDRQWWRVRDSNPGPAD